MRGPACLGTSSAGPTIDLCDVDTDLISMTDQSLPLPADVDAALTLLAQRHNRASRGGMELINRFGIIRIYVNQPFVNLLLELLA